MEKPEFYERSIEIKYRELVEIATEFINFKCIGGFQKVENKTYYYIKIDENITNLDENAEVSAFNEYFKNNFSQYNNDNVLKLDYNELKVKRTLYFKSPPEALKSLIRAWKEWQILSPDFKIDYFQYTI